MRTTVVIQGMHCAACVKRLTAAFQRLPGVSGAHVTLNPPEAHLESDRPLSEAAIDQAARTAGDYSVSIATGDQSRETAHAAVAEQPAAEKPASLYPLGLIVGYIAVTAILATIVRGDGGWRTFMLDFMAGFFLVFSFFKLLDLRGFADAYQSYDILARRSRVWALVYPFIELALGIAYLVRWQPAVTSAVTFTLMLVGSVGVLRAVLRKDRIRCACLGTALNLPMTTVTLLEDLAMAAMAGIALLWGH
jgi:cation transport ATPase